MSSKLEKLLDWYQRKMLNAAPSSPPKAIETVAIIGAGVMGIEIAAANLRTGLRVYLSDANPEALEAAPGRISAEMTKYEKQGGASGTACSQAETGNTVAGSEDLLNVIENVDRFAHCDLILETIVEDAAVKRAVYGCLEPHLAADSLLATNTSTIPIGELAAELARPERFCGIHFCHPVHVNPLVEVIPGPLTAGETVSAAVAYAQSLGKMPIVVEDGPGFVVNRLLLRYTDEAVHLLLDGAGVEQVDRAATAFGMAMGPFRILDEIGLDTSLSAGRVLLAAFPDRVARLPILPLLVKRKQLGQKSGGGFYKYSRVSPDIPYENSLGPNPEALAIIEHYADHDNPPSDKEIVHRLLLAMVLEATIILQEKNRLDPREIDLCMICGLGFPADQGGLLHWADAIGAARILEMVNREEHRGKRFEPTPMLHELAKNDRRFYET
jgi:3-hydroxyacyl-CoA dehydrogenase